MNLFRLMSLHRLVPFCFLSFCILLLASNFVHAQESAQFSQADIDFFENKVRPVLTDNCMKCHGENPQELAGGFALISRRSIINGGDSGSAFEMDSPKESLLLDVISYEGAYDMPPEGKLPCLLYTSPSPRDRG